MQTQPNHTAILLFSRSAREEALHKRFVRQRRTNLKLAQKLVASSRTICSKTGLPFFEIDEKKQEGIDFGHRLTNAIEAIFKKGYEKLIVIGNDCPQLSTEQLLHTAAALSHNEMVLGPTGKGGVYLIGLNGRHFNKASFQNIAWQTENVLGQLLAFAQKLQLSCKLTATYNDINVEEDLRNINQKASLQLRQFIESLLASFQTIYRFQCKILFDFFLFRCSGLRAPPQA